MLGHYLIFNGNCAEALDVYKNAFGAKVTELQRFGDMPQSSGMPVAEAQKDLVLHAKIVIDGGELMCADGMKSTKSGDSMYVTVTVASPDADYVQKAWDALKEDGMIYMELSPTFFADLHGSLRDKYGVNWMFTAQK